MPTGTIRGGRGYTDSWLQSSSSESWALWSAGAEHHDDGLMWRKTLHCTVDRKQGEEEDATRDQVCPSKACPQ